MWSFFGGQSPLEPAMARLHGITNAVYEMCLRNKPFLCISTKHQLLIIGILFFLVLFGHEPLDKFVDVDLMVTLFSFFFISSSDISFLQSTKELSRYFTQNKRCQRAGGERWRVRGVTKDIMIHPLWTILSAQKLPSIRLIILAIFQSRPELWPERHRASQPVTNRSAQQEHVSPKMKLYMLFIKRKGFNVAFFNEVSTLFWWNPACRIHLEQSRRDSPQWVQAVSLLVSSNYNRIEWNRAEYDQSHWVFTQHTTTDSPLLYDPR